MVIESPTYVIRSKLLQLIEDIKHEGKGFPSNAEVSKLCVSTQHVLDVLDKALASFELKPAEYIEAITDMMPMLLGFYSLMKLRTIIGQLPHFTFTEGEESAFGHAKKDYIN